MDTVTAVLVALGMLLAFGAYTLERTFSKGRRDQLFWTEQRAEEALKQATDYNRGLEDIKRQWKEHYHSDDRGRLLKLEEVVAVLRASNPLDSLKPRSAKISMEE